MPGEQIGETRRKRTGRRVVSVDGGFNVEVSFEETGKMLGHDANGFGTYCASPRPDGTLYGEGQGVVMTRDGEMATWKGQGVGKFTGGGAISYRGSLHYTTSSAKLPRLNSVVVVFEYEIDASGNTHTKAWEWK